MKIKDCMCENVCLASPDTTIKEIAKLMNDNDIGSIPICDSNNSICGIITDRDIVLKVVACDKSINSTKAEEIMSKNICCCKQTDEIKDIENKMGIYQIRRIPVCNDKNNVIGIVSLKDLTKIENDEIAKTLKEICN